MSSGYHLVNGIEIPVATTAIKDLEGGSYYMPNLSKFGDLGLVANKNWTGSMEDLLLQQAGLCYPKTEEGYAYAELYSRSCRMVEKVAVTPFQDYGFCSSFYKQMANL